MSNFMRLLMVVMFCSFAVLGFSREWTEEDDIITGIPDPNNVQITVQTISTGHLRLTFSNPDVRAELVELNKRTWTAYTMEGETRTWEVGKPMVPQIARSVRLPDLGNVEIIVHNASYSEYTDIDVLPQQDLPHFSEKGGYVKRDFILDENTYNTNAWYPNDLAVLGEPAILRDLRIAVLGLHPVQVNPVTRSVRIYNYVDLEIVPTGGVGINELTYAPGRVPSFEWIYREVLGADEVNTLDSTTPTLPGSILVLARSDNTQNLNLVQQFVNWKKASGRPTTLVTFSTMPTSSAVMSAIQNAYNTLQPPLEHVVIVGDSEDMPPHTSGYGGTDHPYTQLAGNDILGDVTLGRLSFAPGNSSMLATMVNRTLNYERTPMISGDTTWFTRGWGYAGTSNGITSNRDVIRYCIAMMNQHGVNNTFYDEHSSAVSASLINQRLGPGAVNWAHRAGWVGQISVSDVDGIQNVNKPFAAFNITCSTGNWTDNSEGINERLIRIGTPTAPRGAIGAVATATSGTHVNFNNVVAGGIYWGYGPQGLHQPGPMTWAGKYQLWRNYNVSQSSSVTNFSNWNNLMGDPCAYMWSGVPRMLNADIPNSIPLGQNRLEFVVRRGNTPVPNLVVTAWKPGTNNDETYYRTLTNSEGRAVLLLTNQTPGNLFVTVIGAALENYHPIIDTVVVVNTAGNIAFLSYTVDDDNANGTVGNGDGMASPGETIDLNVRLWNRGTSASVDGITATLASTDPRVTVINSTRAYPNLAPNDSAYGDGTFRIQLAPTLNHNELIHLRLTVSATDTNNNRVLTIPVTIRSIDVRFNSYTFYNASGGTTTLQPGGSAYLGLSIRNIGGIAAQQTIGTLFSRSPYVSVNIADATYPSFPLNVDITNPNNQRFQVSANVLTIPGTVATLGLAMQSGSLRDTVFFNINIGTRTPTHPTGPDNYGYLAYDNTDTSYEMAPTYQWIEIISNGLGTRLNMTDGGENQDANIAYVLPFAVQYYGRTYNAGDTLTVCSNGWVALGWQPHYRNFRNWRLPACEGPRNIIAAFWDDLMFGSAPEGVYRYYDATNHYLVITWNVRTTFGGNVNNEFQIIIYDEQYWPTYTNDAMIKFQYKRFNNVVGDYNDTDYATIGICDYDYINAIEYSFNNAYTAGSAPIPNGNNVNRAILFTTAQNFITGTITGQVRRADNNQPIPNATVFVLSGGYSGVTDSFGHYTIPEVLIGHYNVRCSAAGYNPSIDTVTVYEDSTSVLNFLLTAPGVVIRPDSITTQLHPSGEDTTYQIVIQNTGNGVLTWSSQLQYGIPGDEPNDPWQQVFTFPATQRTPNTDAQLQGIEFDGNYFWVTGANNWSNPNKIYKFDRNGNFITSFDQTDTSSVNGYWDLAWDGTYLYASSSNYVDKLDTLCNIVERRIVPTNPVKALAIDSANGILYVANRVSPIYVIRWSDGVLLRTLTNPGNNTWDIYGMAWYPEDPDQKYLYLMSRDPSNASGANIIKVDPVTGAHQFVVSLGQTGESGAGLTLTTRWNPLIWVLATVLTRPSSQPDRVALFEVAFNSVWIQYSPRAGSINPGDSTVVNVNLASNFMPIGVYRVAIDFITNANPPVVSIPVTMVVDTVSTVNPTSTENALPHGFVLEQNYPNPFNPNTSIRFVLPREERVTLKIFNTMGQEVATLVNQTKLNAGKYTLSFNASSLPTGVYIYRLQAGSFVESKKMILMK
ncbi:MAG: carboxypeptidase regulatory-like domain-containing protein [bacterium]|nr:carboxypeptidase regulatory-like domain-containing protein [bacterium]